MKKGSRKYVRQMPKIYGNLQAPKPAYRSLFGLLRNFLWLGVLAAAVYGIWLSGWFSVRQVEVEGSLLTSRESVENLVPLGTNIWFISKDELSSRILDDTRIEAVDIYRGLPDSLRIVVHERQPSLIWVTGTNQVLIDDQGLSFASFESQQFPTPDSELGKKLAVVPRVVDIKALPVKLDRQVVSPIFITFIHNATKELANALPQVTIDRIEITDSTYDVAFVAKEGLRVYFNTLSDAGVQVRNLSLLVKQNKATLASQVDLRIDRWAYVR